MRLDIALVKNGYVDSRQKASEAIKAGFVSVDFATIIKPSFEVGENANISLSDDKIYVSRSALKLKGFLVDLGFSSDFGNGKKAIDVGASRGGFSEVLLDFGFEAICCVDVGSNQLHNKLRQNPRIQCFENCDIRDFATRYNAKSCTNDLSAHNLQNTDFQDLQNLTKTSLQDFSTQSKPFDLLVCDVSFIKLDKILHSLEMLSDEMILLYKPQFEVGKEAKRNKKGVLLQSNENDTIKQNLARFSQKLEQKGFCIINISKSHIKGKEGNEEFFIYTKK
ncbi:TlyA family RNA methyltransferase [Helicobacter sp. T3_23-1059]